MDDWAVVGVDPAPGKASVACIGGDEFEKIAPAAMPDWVQNLLEGNARVVIAWDAPLSFDPANGYSDRPVDRDVRAWVKGLGTRIGSSAVSVLPFSGCPHWAISCAVLGMPFGKAPAGLLLAATPSAGDKLVIEVHPAVSIARWWNALVTDMPMPRYKRGKTTTAKDVRNALDRIGSGLAPLAIPQAALVDDDHLDAWVAWKMAAGFLQGKAGWIGSPKSGGYVVPIVDVDGSG